MAKIDRRLALWQQGNTLCPLCLKEFSETDARRAVAEVEHTPPLRAGGPCIAVLSCRRCNRQAGTDIDKAAIEVLRQEHDGTLTTSAATISVKIGLGPPPSVDSGLLTMSHPAAQEKVYIRPTRKYSLPPFPKLGFALTWVQRPSRAAQIGLLKAAYLAVFSFVGVPFAKAKALQKVREQIAHPAESVLESFCVSGPRDSGRAICLVHRAGSTCWGVVLEGVMVLLPSMDDEDWNPNLADHPISRVQRFTHAFGSRRGMFFPQLYEVPLAEVGPAVTRGITQVGSLGWQLKITKGDAARFFISVGGRPDCLFFLPTNAPPE